MKITEKINETYKLVDDVKERIGELSKELNNLNNLQQSTFLEYFQSLGLKFDELEIKDFFRKPYILLPKGKQEWYCIVPAFINFQVGFFDRREGNYNIYIINKYSRWMNDIPDFMSEEIDLEEPDKIYIKDGELIFEENLLDKVRTKYGHRIKNLQKDRATIKQGCEFDLIAELIDDGNLPFIPRAVDKEDLREKKLNFTMEGKYLFQEEAFKEWLKYGSLGVYWMTGAGKSFLGMNVLDSLKFDEKDKRKLLVTMTSTLVDQWKLYFEQYAPRLSEEVDIVTYNAFHKIKDKKYICVVFDENDRLPADTFSRFSTLNVKYRLGLSATPYREDGRTNYIFALTGKPMGLDWNATLKILGKKLHQINIYILKTEQDKIRKTGELLDLNKKTLIFSDSINLGKSISNKFSIPFIYGETKKRLDILNDNKVNVVSRVMDYGISIKDLKHIIEADFLFGSRKQQVQRTGRLLHSLSKDSRHDILFTSNEFNKYKKRLFGLMEKGFKLNFFNEVSRDKIKIDESDFKPMQEIKLPEKKAPEKEKESEPERDEDPQQQEIIHNKVDYENFLRHQTVKDLIKKALEDSKQPKVTKGTLALILQKRQAVTYEDIRKSLGLVSASNIPTGVSPLEKYEIIKKVKDGGMVKVDFNIEGINEIVNLSNQRKKSEKLMEELFKD